MPKTWMNHFLEMAHLVASKSKDPNTQVGCILVSEDRIIVATGYNGLPRGVEDKPERMLRPAKYLWTSHAEENAVSQAARVGMPLKNSTAFVTHMPCSRCARTLIQAGIVAVVVDNGSTSMPKEEFDVAMQMFNEAGVRVSRLLELHQ